MRVHRIHQVYALLAVLMSSLRSARQGRRWPRRREWIFASRRRLRGPTGKAEWVRRGQRHRGAALLLLLLLLLVWSRITCRIEADAGGSRRGELWVCVEGEDAGFVVTARREVMLRLRLGLLILALLQVGVLWLLSILLLLLLLLL